MKVCATTKRSTARKAVPDQSPSQRKPRRRGERGHPGEAAETGTNSGACSIGGYFRRASLQIQEEFEAFEAALGHDGNLPLDAGQRVIHGLGLAAQLVRDLT